MMGYILERLVRLEGGVNVGVVLSIPDLMDTASLPGGILHRKYCICTTKILKEQYTINRNFSGLEANYLRR